MSCFCGFRLEPEVEISNSVAQILYLSVYLSDISFNLSPLPLGWLLFFISFQFTALVQYISSRCWQACFFFLYLQCCVRYSQQKLFLESHVLPLTFVILHHLLNIRIYQNI